ncbi:retrovirus-related pol polyprotein from transposon RE1 [Citrus sinensis]|nr:retrovirus-related pol polyprotein from transposon RE1 [Citrus sinensis]
MATRGGRIARGATTDIRMDALQGKKLQQLSDDPVSFEITYHGEHTCQLSLENPPVPSSLPELEIAQVMAVDMSDELANVSYAVQFLQSETESASIDAELNPAYTTWKRKDQLLLSWLMLSISIEILSLVVNSKTSIELWTSLEQQFGSETSAKKVHLKIMVNNLRKGSMTVTEFFGKLKTIADELAIAGNPISSLDFLTHLISRLDSILLSHEARLEANQLSSSKEAKLNYAANIAQTGFGTNNNNKKPGGQFNNNWNGGQFNNNWNKNGGFRGGYAGGRGGYGRNFPQGQERGNWNGGWNGSFGNFPQGGVLDQAIANVTCQICFKPRHTAAECRNRFNKDYIPFNNPYQNPPRAVFLATFEGAITDQGWYIDSGATHHITNNLQNLQIGNEYSGNQLLLVGNGQGLHISHIGYACFQTSCNAVLHLRDTLCVPKLTKNLISVSKLLEDNTDITIEFVTNMCFIKDKMKEQHLAQGIAKKGLYLLLLKNDCVSNSSCLTYAPSSMIFVLNNPACKTFDTATNNVCNSQFQVNSTKLANLFHQKFGHPNKHVLKSIMSSLSVDYSSISAPYFCDACQYGKAHQMFFYSTGIKTKVPLELIHTDLWGPAPLPSLNGYRYYISFVDDYSRYCWIFPLTLKSESLDTFKYFKTLVEKQFGYTLKTLQSDWEGEYRSFQSFLEEEGISRIPHLLHLSLLQQSFQMVTVYNILLVHLFQMQDLLLVLLPQISPLQLLIYPHQSKVGMFKPKTYLTVTQNLEPQSVKAALIDTKWRGAMQAKFDALQNNKTWTLVPREQAGKIVGNKWVFRVKYNPDGSISKYKARLVAKGFHQTQGVDFFETFSPVVKPCTIRIILSIAVMNQWSIRQLDVNNVFRNGILTEEVFMHQPEGFLHPQYASHHKAGDIVVVLIYVDDILITGSDNKLIKEVIGRLGSEFALKDLGDFNYFLGLEVTPSAVGMHLSQTKYIGDLLKKAQMINSKGCPTPMRSSDKLVKDRGAAFENPSLYRSLIGSLQYITLTRPEIALTVNKLSQFLIAPTVIHWQACKRLLRYLQSTTEFGFQFFSTGKLTLTTFSDADWGSDLDDRKSIVSRSTAESEYQALALAVSEVLWISYVLKELKMPPLQVPVLHCDNKSAEALASNPKYHSRTKHIELDLHFVRDHIAQNKVHVSHVPSCDQVADVLTKPLAFDQFNYLRSKLNVIPRP